MNNSSSEQLTGHVIVAARQLEQAMRRAGASSATGIHDAVTELGSRLPEPTAKQLRRIASVRNRLAHGEELEPGFDLAAFDTDCAEAGRVLAALGNSAPEEPVPEKIAEADAEFHAAFRHRLRQFGALPLADAVYFTVLTAASLRRSAEALTLLMFFFIGAMVTAGGVIDGDRMRLWLGLGFLTIHWAGTLRFWWRRRAAFPGLPAWLGPTPVAGVAFLAAAGYRSARKLDFLTGALPLAALLVAAGCLRGREWRWAAILAAAAWLWGLALLWMRRKSVF